MINITEAIQARMVAIAEVHGAQAWPVQDGVVVCSHDTDDGQESVTLETVQTVGELKRALGYPACK